MERLVALWTFPMHDALPLHGYSQGRRGAPKILTQDASRSTIRDGMQRVGIELASSLIIVIMSIVMLFLKIRESVLELKHWNHDSPE
jgi:hypothetical protein